MSTFRTISVHVEEPTPGLFVWVLSERSGGNWRELKSSSLAVRSYKVAMADALVALQAMVDDLDIGPRTTDASILTHAKKKREPTAAEGKAAAEKAAPAKSFFGFGPVR